MSYASDALIDAQKRKIEQLKAENAKLRERVAELDELLPESGRWYRAETVEAYVAEIAKLRELVEDMLDCIDIRMAFGRPPTSEMYEGFAQRAGELGIEEEQ